MAQDKVLSDAMAYRKARILRSIANRDTLQAEASANKSSSNTLGGYSTVAQLLADASKYHNQPPAEKPKDAWEQFQEGAGHVYETPVIKQAIDTIATPGMMVSNALSNMQHRMYEATDAGKARAKEHGQEDLGDFGNRMQTMVEGLNPGTFVMDTLAGVGQGLSGGIGGNKNDVKFTSDIIRDAQQYSGIDPNSSESKWVAGLGGFAGDVLMDPLNAIPLAPTMKAVQGAKQGSFEFKSAKKAANKMGTEMPENFAPSRWEHMKNEAQSNVAAYKADKLRVEAARETEKAFKKGARKVRGSDTQSARYIIENLSTLREAVGKPKADAIIAKVLDTNVKDIPTPAPIKPASAVEEAGKLADDVTPTEVIPEAAVPAEAMAGAHLSNFKEPTQAEKLFDLIGKYKSVGSKPRYGEDVIQRVKDLIAAKTVKAQAPVEEAVAKVDNLAGKEVPDIEATVKEIVELDKAMGGGTIFQVPSAVTGKRIPVTTDQMIEAIRKDFHDKAVFDPHWEVLKKNELAVTKKVGKAAPKATANPQVTPDVLGHRRVTDKELEALGVDPSHFKDIRKGTPIEQIMHDMPTEDIGTLTADIRSGKIKGARLKPFYDLLDTTKPKDVANIVDTIAATPAYAKAAEEMAKYGSERAGIPNPELGVSGSARLATPSEHFTAEDILAGKTASTPEQAQAFLEAVVTENAQAILAHPQGAQLRVMADDLLKETIDKQRQPAGPLRAKGGASVAETLDAAKYETKHNTHSAIHRMGALAIKLRAAGFTHMNKFDEAYMLVLKDIDNRLRLAGFDPHLSNMAMTTDKLVVRLAPSDVLGLMTQSDRIKFIHGNMHNNGKSVIREFLPTTVLDMGEVLVRSATKLGADGAVDMDRLILDAIETLQGKFQSSAKGTRVIKSNLDTNTLAKNHEQILHQMDLDNKKAGKATNFKEQFLAKRSNPAEALAVVKTAKEAYPELYKEILTKRMDTATHELLKVFTQGKFPEKASRINDLISLNMRNASVMGGHVATEINEASAAFSAKILDALDNGTAGDFISNLVAKPDYKATDSVARQVVNDNARIVRESVASPEEIKHFTAAEKNVNEAIKEGGRSEAEVARQMLEEKMIRARGGNVVTKTANKEKIRQKQAAKNNKDAYQKDRDLETETSKPVKDQDKEALYDLAHREINKDIIWRAFGPRRWFDRRAGMRATYDQITGSLHAIPLIMTEFHGLLRALRVKGYTKTQLHEAFQALKQGSPNDPIAAELNGVLDKIFDPAQNNFLSRNTIGPRHFNKVLSSVGFDPKKYFIPENLTAQEMRNVWKKWDVDNVEDFFSKMMGAVTKTAHEVSMGASFSKHFGEVAAKPGYVKIIDKSGKNSFYDLIDHDLYYPKPIADEFVHIGRMLDESRSFKPKDPLYKFVTQIMDPTVSLLKMTQTTLKPGHHVMSITGDLWRNNLALSTIGYADPTKQLARLGESYRILKSNVGAIEELSEFDRFTRVQRITKNIRVGTDEHGVMHVDKTGEVYANIGDGGMISHEDMYAIMQSRGIATPAFLGGGPAEDMLAEFGGLSEATNVAAKGVSKATNVMDTLVNHTIPAGKGKKFSLNKFTANRDTFTRGALFLGAMRSRKFKSLEEAVDYSEAFVRKWSPTAADLSAFESKYARRMFFYYTWLRGMIPRIVESALLTPGVAVIPNRAMYNLGVANGIDLNSLGDPFPPDRLFPDWFRNKVIGPSYMSPEGRDDLWGFNPTGPLGDVLNSLGSGIAPKDFVGPEASGKVIKTFLGMSNPFFKAPAETFVMHENLQTGAPVEDNLQYYQDMIGPVRTASRALGKDLYPVAGPDGNLVLPNRSEKKYRSGMTTEETVQNALPEILNYLTGAQFTNYTSDSADNSSRFQQREKLIEQRRMNERTRQ